MSELLTFNTETGIVQQEDIHPFTVLDGNCISLKTTVPEYDISILPNPVVTKIVKQMRMTMKLYQGLGLAANQCGIMERMFIIGIEDFQLVCINPKVINASAQVKKDKEMCLSFPALTLNIPRPTEIDVEFYNENGQKKEMHLAGLTARCFLHEFDHLIGVRMIDYVKPVALAMALKKQNKMIKNHVRKNR